MVFVFCSGVIFSVADCKVVVVDVVAGIVFVVVVEVMA